MKYLLTTGVSTDRVELYILDLFKLYFEVGIDEIPNSSIGFNKILTNVNKPDLKSTVEKNVRSLVTTFSNKFSKVKITLDEVIMIDESTFKVIISANSETESYEISSGLY